MNKLSIKFAVIAVGFGLLAGCASSTHNSSPVKDYPSSGKFQKPLQGQINSRFSLKVDPAQGLRRIHHGVDIPAPKNTPIKAAASGRVVVADTWRGYGKVIIIDHGDGWISRYAHMSKFDAKKGDRVSKGQRIGRVGATGNATGPHLHFEIRRHDQPINPEAFF